MTEPAITPRLAATARLLFTATVMVCEEASHPQGIKALLEQCSGRDGSPVGLHILRCYSDIVSEPALSSGYWSFYLSGRSFRQAIEDVFTLHPPPKVEAENSDDRDQPAPEQTLIGKGPLVLDAQHRLGTRVRDWLARWSDYKAAWLEWSRSNDKARAAPVEETLPGTLAHEPARVLSDDQEAACEHLLAQARTRKQVSLAAVPACILGRWSVPFLVGPAGSGKTFVCQETARRLDRVPCRRWDIGSWIITANRSTHTTLEQIQAFVEANLRGCIVYLAGADALCIDAAHNASYFLAVANEVERLLDQVSERPLRFLRRDGTASTARVFVVLGGQFAGLWGTTVVGGYSGAESWRLADREPLADARAVAAWLAEHSNLPTGILRRLAAPLVLRPLGQEEAGRLAARFQASLPASLDGIGMEELAAALHGPPGWRGVDLLIEQALISGYEGQSTLPEGTKMPTAEKPTATASTTPSMPSGKKPPKAQRLGNLLGIRTSRTPVIVKAQRLGLTDALSLEGLAHTRGHKVGQEDPEFPVLMPSPQIEEAEFNDLELALALLSPCWELQMGATVLHGVIVLRAALEAFPPSQIVAEAMGARSDRIVRHIALLAQSHQPTHRLWRGLLDVLAPVSPRHPGLKPGIMPDERIKLALKLRER